ncbi:MAG: hydrogenase maturation peptidase HycI [Methanobacteriaceae archaeon]|nr:hydrogenase maturation peptidase HycI [Methanobacteriaceae archaeon]
MILGIGNDMRGDDALGSVLAQKMSHLFADKKNLIVFDCKTVPENFTGAIKKEKPSHIILLDAVEMNKPPGHIRLVEKEEIDNYSISTHAMPLSFFIKYLESTSPSEIFLLGIQPKKMNLIGEISREVEKSMNHVLKVFNKVINQSSPKN